MTASSIRRVIAFVLTFSGAISGAIVGLATAPPARADTQVEIVATDPAADAALAVGASFYVRATYTTDEPVNLWARAYFNGKPVERVMTNASGKYSGSGEALGWFALNQAGSVDEVRIIAGGGTPYAEWVAASKPLQLRWGTDGGAADNSAQWVGELQSATAERNRADAQQRASEPVPVRDIALFSGFMLLMLAILVASIGAPLWSLWKWRGGWRIAAAVPVAVMTFVVLRILFDTARDPTSHNLWPFEILMLGGISLASIAVLKVARRFTGVQS